MSRSFLNMILISATIFFLSGMLFLIMELNGNIDLEKAALIGNSFGVFGAFASGFGLIGVAGALWYQGQQLKTQTNAIIEERRQLEQNRMAVAKSNYLQAISAFIQAASNQGDYQPNTELISTKMAEMEDLLKTMSSYMEVTRPGEDTE